MNRYEVKFGLGRAGSTDFVGKGYVTLYDTCLVVSGATLRFRIPLVSYLLRHLAGVSGYRTIPYGAVESYRASRSIRHRETFGLIVVLHRLTYRLPSGSRALVQFTVARKADRSHFASALSDRIAATKALYER